MAENEQTGTTTQNQEATGLVRELFQALEDEDTCQWHREHDKHHDLYLRTKKFLGIK